MKRFTKKIKEYFREVIKIKGSSHSIALGFSIGTFIAFFPTFGMDIIIVLLVTLLYPKVNKFSLFGALLFWNPLFMLPFSVISYGIGSLIFGSSPVLVFEVVVLNDVYNFTRRLFVGSSILALVFSISSYFIIKKIAENYWDKKTRVKNKKKEKNARKLSFIY